MKAVRDMGLKVGELKMLSLECQVTVTVGACSNFLTGKPRAQA